MGRRLAGWAIAGLAAFTMSAAHAGPIHDKAWPEFPPEGTSYEDAKTSLLKQGMKVVSEDVHHPLQDHPEVDCEQSDGASCRAIFLYTTKDGWGRYVVVGLRKSDLKVNDAGFARSVDGLPNIPPALAPDIPKLGRDYISARRQLIHLGFKPIKLPTNFSYCDEDCEGSGHLPEAFCAADGAGCYAYWRSNAGRVMIVMTRGEIIKESEISYAYWADSDDLRDLKRMMKNH